MPLLDDGALLTGIDQSQESIKVAQHASKGRGTFLVGDICAIDIHSSTVDCVLLIDVLDHIPHFAKVLREASRVLRPGGKLFVGTINRNLIAHFLTVTLGESLGFIPKGTHDSHLFITPEELVGTAQLYHLACRKVQGEWPVFFQTIFKRAITLRRSKSVTLAYSAVFEKVSHAE